MPMQEKFSTAADNLFAANQMMPVVSDVITIPSGEVLSRGTLVSVEGKAVTAADEVYGVLAQDVDASTDAVESVVYLTGEFNESALKTGNPDSGSLAANECKTAARKIGIFIKSNVE